MALRIIYVIHICDEFRKLWLRVSIRLKIETQIALLRISKGRFIVPAQYLIQAHAIPPIRVNAR